MLRLAVLGLLLAVVSTASGQGATQHESHTNLKSYFGDLHRHAMHYNYIQNYYQDYFPTYDGEDCVESKPAGWESEVHEIGEAKHVCTDYQASGFDFVGVTPHDEQSCIGGTDCAVGTTTGIYTWVTNPSNIGLSAERLGTTLGNLTCGFPNYATSDPNDCVSPSWDEIASHRSGMKSIQGTFSCLMGSEVSFGSKVGDAFTACQAHPKAASAGASNHMNIIWPGGSYISRCIAGQNYNFDSADYCIFEDGLFAEANRTGAVVINNHPNWDQGDDPDSCACTSRTSPGGCDIPFVQRDRLSPGGLDAIETDLMELGGGTNPFSDIESVLLAWNRGFPYGVSYGSDRHGRNCSLPDPEDGAVLVLANDNTDGDIASGLLARRTVVVTGFDGDAVPRADRPRLEFYMKDDAGDSHWRITGDHIAVDDGAVVVGFQVQQQDALIASNVNNQIAKVQLVHNSPSWDNTNPDDASSRS